MNIVMKEPLFVLPKTDLDYFFLFEYEGCPDLDASAMLLDDGGVIMNDSDFVFYNSELRQYNGEITAYDSIFGRKSSWMSRSDPISSDGSICLLESEESYVFWGGRSNFNVEIMRINLEKVNQNIHKIVFCMSEYVPQQFTSSSGKMSIHIVSGLDNEIFSSILPFEVDPSNNVCAVETIILTQNSDEQWVLSLGEKKYNDLEELIDQYC